MARTMLGHFLTLNTFIVKGDADMTFSYIQSHNLTGRNYLEMMGDCSSPIVTAARYGHPEIVERLLSSGFIQTSRHEEPALHVAAGQGHLDVVKVLLDHDCYNPYLEWKPKGWPPLLRAAESGHLHVVRYLIDRGASTRATTCEDQTLLHVATLSGYLDLCEFVLSLDYVDIDARDNKGCTALMWAVLHSFAPIASLLLEAGASVDSNLRYSFFNRSLTHLHVATLLGNLETARMLFEHGADPEIEDDDGLTPAHFAVKQIDSTLLKFFVLEVNVSLDFVGVPVSGFQLIKKRYDTTLFLLQAGYLPSPDEWRLIAPHLDYVPDFYKNSIVELLTSPRNLQDLCCFALRRILRGRISDADRLPIPVRLVDFIKLRHLRTE